MPVSRAVRKPRGQRFAFRVPRFAFRFQLCGRGGKRAQHVFFVREPKHLHAPEKADVDLVANQYYNNYMDMFFCSRNGTLDGVTLGSSGSRSKCDHDDVRSALAIYNGEV